MQNALQTYLDSQETKTITADIWEIAPSSEHMITMLWESLTLPLNFQQNYQIAKQEQQLRLFAAWTARRVTHLLNDPRSHNAIETAERFAIGTAGRSEMNRAHLNAKTVVIELSDTYKPTDLPTTSTLDPKQTLSSQPQSVSSHTLTGAALLHAAATASMACHFQQLFSGLHVAETCATYSRKALYWELLAENAGTERITEFLKKEDRRQAQALRVFTGNPFNQTKFPAIHLPDPDPLNQKLDYYSVQQQSCNQTPSYS